MVDPSFVSTVVALLVCRHGGEPSGDKRVVWRGTPRLVDVITARFADNPAARDALEQALAAPGSDTTPAPLAAAVRRHAEADPEFLAEIRQLVIAAYGDSVVAAHLPDPSPRM